MEDISKRIAATSKPFRFLVGPDKREFTIHSALVAHQSRMLEVLVQGQFKEAIDCTVLWDDVDEMTFTSFWQYVYTGHYDVPEPLISAESDADATSANGEAALSPQLGDQLADEIELEEPAEMVEEPSAGFEWQAAVPEPEPEPEPELWPSKKWRKKGATKITKRELLWSDFTNSWRVDTSIYSNDKIHGPKTMPENDVVLPLHHAKVYVLADRYGIARLMDVSFHKLHQTLVKYEVSSKSAKGIVALLRFCYLELVPEKLSRIAVHYAACNVEKLWSSEEFQELLEGCPTLSKCLVGSMLPRMD